MGIERKGGRGDAELDLKKMKGIYAQCGRC